MAIKDIVDQPLNVKDLEMPERIPLSEPIFDPERDLTPEEKEKIRALINNVRNAKAGYFPTTLIRYAKNLFPGEQTLTNPDVRQMTIDFYDGQIRYYRDMIYQNKVVRYRFLDVSASLKDILPDEFVKMNVTSEEMLLMKHEATTSRFEIFIDNYLEIKTLDPDFSNALLEQNMWARILQDKNNYNSTESLDALVMFSKLKLIYGDKVNDLGFSISDGFWAQQKELMHQSFSKDTEQGVFEGTYRAWALAVLASEKAEITDEGIKLTFPKPPSSVGSSPPVPEERKF